MKAHPDGTAAAWLVIALAVLAIATVVGSFAWLIITRC